MDVARTITQMRDASAQARSRGLRIGLVPTMGCLHQGHLELVRRARDHASWVVVSIFVNPTQFGPNEDLGRYPRDLDRDAELCRKEGVDALFVPSADEMYPAGFQTYITVHDLAEPLCGASRPGHFRGVATVVAKLFHIVAPRVAVFGEKDYQQLQVVRRMVQDLDLGVEIVGVPTFREPDGLAMSSRNVYLSASERQRALSLSRALAKAQERVTEGERRGDVLLAEVRKILAEAQADVDYAELRDPETLEPAHFVEPEALLALAARIGATRLIDNRILRAPAAGPVGASKGERE